MKLKRFISAVAALSMSLSCFAGLTITAKAEDLTVPGENEAISEVLIGTKAEDGKSVTAETFDEEGAKVPAFSGNLGLAIADVPTPAGTSSNNNLNLSGKALQIYGKNGPNSTLSFASAKTGGRIVFSGLYYQNTNAKVIDFLDTSGNAVLSIQFKDSTNTGGGEYLVAGNSYTATWASGGDYKIDNYNGTPNGRQREYDFDYLVIDITKNQVTFAGKIPDRRSGANKVVSASGTLNYTNISSIAGIKITSNANSTDAGYRAYLDNVKLYSIESNESKYPYTINYQYTDDESNVTTVKTDSGENLKDMTVTADSVLNITEGDNKGRWYVKDGAEKTLTVKADETGEANVLNVPVRPAETYSVTVEASTGGQIQGAVDVVEGGSITYYPSRFMTDDKNKVTAEIDEANYSRTATPTESGALTVNYTAYAGNDKYFVEISGDGQNNRAKLSGGSGSRRFKEGVGNGNSDSLFTIPEDGVYTIEFPTYKYGNSDGTVQIFKNKDLTTQANIGGNVAVSGSINYMQSEKIENIHLWKGDTIHILNDGANAVVDYLLLTRTGDIPAPIVGTPTALDPSFADVSVTGKVGDIPEFATLGELPEKATLKVEVTNPVDGTYPSVTIGETTYTLTADDIEAVAGDNKATYYFQFKANKADGLKNFGTVKITYGTGDDAPYTTHNFNAE